MYSTPSLHSTLRALLLASACSPVSVDAHLDQRLRVPTW